MTFVLITTLFGLYATSYAEPTKIITLKDGSVLNGNVVELIDGFYTFETSNLGNIEILESDVLSITSPQTVGTSIQNSDGADEAQKALLKQKVQEVQREIIGDEEITTELQNIVQDEEIRSILSDQDLINDVMSFDQKKIEQNKSIKDLMNNPKMQDLINQIQQKIPTQ